MFDNLNWLQSPNFTAFLIIIVSIWSAVWKGLALWKAVKKDQKYWFIALIALTFVINTFGIVEIIYLAFFQKKEKKK